MHSRIFRLIQTILLLAVLIIGSQAGNVIEVQAAGTWTEQTTSGSRVWRGITSSSDGTKLAAVVYGGNIYTSTDSGATWTAQTNAGSRNWRSITSSSDGTKLAAAVFGGYIYTSTDSGATWTERLSSGARNWYSITSSTDGTKIAAGIEDGYIYTSTDSGGAWTTQTASGSRYWYGIASSADGVKLAAAAFTYGGYISTSVNSGAAWSTNSNSSGSRAWNGIASSADGVKLAAVVGSGYIYTSTDSGVTWGTQSDSSGSRDWRSITSSSDGTKLAAVAYGGYIYTSTDSGASWTQETSAGSRNWQSISSASDGGKISAAVDSGYIYTFTPDTTAPTITNVSSDKTNGTYTVGEVIDIDVTFSEAVTSTGNVTVTLETGATDRTCTFTVSNGTTGTCNYTVQAGDTSADLTVSSISGTIADQSANAMVSFTPATNLAANKALVIETTAPTLVQLSPLDNAVGVAIDTNFIIEFSETVDVESGNVVIFTAEGITIATIPITDPQITGTGTDTVTINPTADLQNGTSYYIQIATTALDDTAGNSYAGITDSTTWSFTTVSLPSSGGATGQSTEINASCSISDTTIKTGDEIDIEMDIEATVNGESIQYSFKWIKVLTGSDKETSHTFDTEGEYIIKGQVKTDYADKTITCDTVTVSDNNISNSTSDDEEEEDNTTIVETTQVSPVTSTFKDVINTYKDFLTTLHNLGITLPSNVISMLDIKPSSTASSATPNFTVNLELGDKHHEVKLLQQFLNNNGYTVAQTGPGSKGNETTIFGYATKAALIRFQVANNISPAVGYFGTVTRAVFNR
jgi:hypothetical protein